MSRSTVDWIGPLLFVLALRAVMPATLGSEPAVADDGAAGSSRIAPKDAGAAAAGATQAAGSPRAVSVSPCDAAVQAVIARSYLAPRLSWPLPREQALLVMLPDPIDTPAGSVFDGGLEALVTGFSSLGYVRDHFLLPWSARADSAEREALRGCPGAILFRPLAAQGQPIVALIAGESSTFGADKAMLGAALGMVAQGAAASTPTPALRILGPYYSATAWTLAVQLAALAPQGGSYRVASGSMTSRAEGALVAATPGVTEFRAFAPAIDRRRDAIARFLGYGAGDRALAVLQESGTVYGQRQIKHGASLLQVEYPPNVSALRDAYAALDKSSGGGKAPEGAKRSELPAAVERRALARDMLPVFAAEHSVVTHDLALRDAAAVLAEERIGDAIVTGVLPQDVVFLSQRLKRSTPDLRVVFYNMDRLFTHADYASDLRGSLVVTAHAFGAEPSAELRTTLSRDAAHGIYHALRFLFGEPPAQPREALTIGVLSQGRLWPLTAEAGAARAAGVQVPAPFWLGSAGLLALALLHSVLMLRVSSAVAGAAAPSGRGPQRVLALLRRVEDHAVGRSRAWFLTGLRPCRDPLVRPWHTLMAGTGQAALVAMLLLLSLVWWMIVIEGAPGVSDPARLAFAVAVSVSLFGTGSILLLQLRAAVRGARVAAAARARSAEEEQEADRLALELDPEVDLLRRTQRWARGLAGVLGAVIGLVTLLCGVGLWLAERAAPGMFLARAIDPGSGVSPLSIVLLCLAFVYCTALTQAARMRILDVGDELVQGERKRHVLSRAVEERAELLHRERALYEAALLPGGIRYLVGVCAALLLPVLIVAHVRPSAFFRTHDFTLENGLLSAAMALAMLSCLGLTTVTVLQVLRLWRHLTEVLQALAASDLAEAFRGVAPPLRRTVAEQLAQGPQDELELHAARRALAHTSPESIARPSGCAPAWRGRSRSPRCSRPRRRRARGSRTARRRRPSATRCCTAWRRT